MPLSLNFTRRLAPGFRAKTRPARLPFFFAIAAGLALTATPSYGQADQAPINAAAALADLAKLESTRAQALEDDRNTAISALQQAAATPSAAARLYESAVKVTGEVDFADWKKRNAELLRDKAFQEAAQIHLRYLVLTLERGRSEDSTRGAAPSLQYARELAGWITRQHNQQLPGPAIDLLDKPLAEGPFVRWFRLRPFLPSGQVWEQRPGHLDKILEKNVRIPWRTSGDARLDSTWQLELETAAALASANGDRAAEEFNTRTAPALSFRRAVDRAAAGQPNRAAADILGIARKHPSHPDFPQWAAALRGMLAKKPPAD